MPTFRLQFRADHTGRPPAVLLEADAVVPPKAAGQFFEFWNESTVLVAAYNPHAIVSVTLVPGDVTAQSAVLGYGLERGGSCDYGSAEVEEVGEVRQFGQVAPVRKITRPVPRPPHGLQDSGPTGPTFKPRS